MYIYIYDIDNFYNMIDDLYIYICSTQIYMYTSHELILTFFAVVRQGLAARVVLKMLILVHVICSLESGWWGK